jgi:hypothetical protein
MKFMLIITWDEKQGKGFTPDQLAEIGKRHANYVQQLIGAGKLVSGERLATESEGTRVRVRGGKQTLIDGPFSESKEALGGFYILECASKAEAVEWAAKCPSAEYGTVEARPVEAT